MRDAHCKAATGADQLRRIEPARDALAVERRRHDHETQVRAQIRLHVEGERGAEVAMQMAFVEFVEQDRADAGQLGVVLDHPGQDAFGDDFDARRRRDLRFEADAIAYRLADAFTALRSHELGRRAGGDPARFEQQDLGAGKPAGVEQRGWHLRRLAGAGRCFQHHACGPDERRQKIRQDRVDGRGGSVHASVYGLGVASPPKAWRPEPQKERVRAKPPARDYTQGARSRPRANEEWASHRRFSSVRPFGRIRTSRA